MNNQIDKIINELSKFPYVDNFKIKIAELESEVSCLFSKIRKCDSIIEAESYFNDLNSIQTALARLVFKDDIHVSDKLKLFIHDFDRLDDAGTKKELMDKIQDGLYI